MRRSKEVVITGAPESHYGAVSLPQQDGTSFFDPFCIRTEKVYNKILQGSDATKGAHPTWFEVKQILHRCRHPMERSQSCSGHQRLLGLFGSLTGIFEPQIHEGIEALIALLDTLDECIHNLHWRKLAAPDADRKLCCCYIRQFIR